MWGCHETVRSFSRGFGMKCRVMSELVGPDGIVGDHEVGGHPADAAAIDVEPPAWAPVCPSHDLGRAERSGRGGHEEVLRDGNRLIESAVNGCGGGYLRLGCSL
jgi:hypothetical protein